MLVLHRTEVLGLPVPEVVPVPGGGVQLEWCIGSHELELEFGPDGSLEYLVTEVPTDRCVEGRLEKADFGAVRQLLMSVSD